MAQRQHILVCGFFLVFLLFLLVAGRTKLISEGDTLWHVVVGREILETGRFVERDAYSYTRSGHAWIANQWLAECLMALADRAARFDGLTIVTASLSAGLFCWLTWRFVAVGLDGLLALLFVMLTLAAAAANLHARPSVASIILIGVVQATLLDLESNRISLRRSFWLAPTFLLWSNVHGGVLGGLGTLLITLAGWSVAPLLGVASPLRSRRDAALAWALAGVCGMSLLITPYGWKTLESWLTILRLPFQDFIVEHAPLRIWSADGAMVLILLVAYAVMLGWSPRRTIRVTYFLPAVWFCLTLSRTRHAALFAVVASLTIAELLETFAGSPWLRRRKWLVSVPRTRFPHRATAFCVSVSVLLLVGAAIAMRVNPRSGGFQWARPAPNVWPAELLPAVQTYAAGAAHPRIFNEPALGGFLIYAVPKAPVFIDTRFELYGAEFLGHYLRAARDPLTMHQWQEEFGFTASLVEKGSPFERYFFNRDAWRLAGESRAVRFFVRADEARPPQPGSKSGPRSEAIAPGGEPCQ